MQDFCLRVCMAREASNHAHAPALHDSNATKTNSDDHIHVNGNAITRLYPNGPGTTTPDARSDSDSTGAMNGIPGISTTSSSSIQQGQSAAVPQVPPAATLGMLCVPAACVNHPWWDGGQPRLARFAGWSVGDGALVDVFPGLTYHAAPHGLELGVLMGLAAVLLMVRGVCACWKAMIRQLAP